MVPPMSAADARRLLPCSHLGAAALEDALSQALGLRIVELNLSSNDLDADTLPVFLPAIFPRVRVLRLKYNKLSSLPLAAIERLAYLEHLELDGNQITAVDEAVLASLPASLRRLSLSSNGVSRLPDGLGVTCCRALTHLNVSNNPLVELPDSLGSCPMLTHLDVSSCRLQALPASLAVAPSLQRLFCQVLQGTVLRVYCFDVQAAMLQSPQGSCAGCRFNPQYIV